MWRVIHIEKTGENIFLETGSEYLARDAYKSAEIAVEVLGMPGARLEHDPNFTGNYEVVSEIYADDLKESIIKKLLNGVDVRSLLSESTTLSTDFEQSIYSGLKSALTDWIDYIADEAQWMRFVSKIAHLVWDDINK